MKKNLILKLLFVLALSTMYSCEGQNTTKKSTGIIYNGCGGEVEEMTIEGCQYIGHFSGSNTDWGTHKGNCNNPIHKKYD